jgi:hypothetical protein
MTAPQSEYERELAATAGEEPTPAPMTSVGMTKVPPLGKVLAS